MSTWAERAHRAYEALIAAFWDETSSLFLDRFPFERRPGPFNYWWQAHALDALIDAHERDRSGLHLERAARLLSGIRERNGGRVTNDYYDDMEWLALACLRAFDAGGGSGFLEATRELWAEIQTGWNAACGGGIAWRKMQMAYKNTPANAPAAILGARLYRRFHQPNDLLMADRIWGWLAENLIDPQTGFVWDGMNREGDGRVDRDWAFTYNQGVVIGAALELHGITRDPGLLEAAGRTAHAARERLTAPGMVALPDEGAGDAGLFKGILVRYLTGFALAAGSDQGGGEALTWLEGNARLALERGLDANTGLLGRSWAAQPEYPLDLSSALSGVMLLEAMARLEHAGVMT